MPERTLFFGETLPNEPFYRAFRGIFIKFLKNPSQSTDVIVFFIILPGQFTMKIFNIIYKINLYELSHHMNCHII